MNSTIDSSFYDAMPPKYPLIVFIHLHNYFIHHHKSINPNNPRNNISFFIMLNRMLLLFTLMTLTFSSPPFMYHLTGNCYNLLKGNPLSDEYNDYFADPGFLFPIFEFSYQN
jgi:hypothetical protein